MTQEIKNAIITDTQLGIEDHGILTALITLDYGGTHQGFGGYRLYGKSTWENGPNYAGHFIKRVLAVADVPDWEKLVGKPIRVKMSERKIKAIGHIIKDIWFNPELEFTNASSRFTK